MASDTQTAAQRSTIALLDADPALGAALSDADRTAARRELIAPVFELAPGDWNPSWGEHSDHLGLLLVSGVMTREVVLGDSRSIELLNEGDLLRPWQEDGASFTSAEWQVLEPSRLAVLEQALAASLARYPQIVNSLIDRAMLRSRNAALNNAITNTVGLERRILLLFWHLAERWGAVSSGGVEVPLELTHQLISDLVGARRPSVTTALGTLAAEGRLERRAGRGWVLRGEAPVAGGDGAAAKTR